MYTLRKDFVRFYAFCVSNGFDAFFDHEYFAKVFSFALSVILAIVQDGMKN